jgi:hypothetical protein
MQECAMLESHGAPGPHARRLCPSHALTGEGCAVTRAQRAEVDRANKHAQARLRAMGLQAEGDAEGEAEGDTEGEEPAGAVEVGIGGSLAQAVLQAAGDDAAHAGGDADCSSEEEAEEAAKPAVVVAAAPPKAPPPPYKPPLDPCEHYFRLEDSGATLVTTLGGTFTCEIQNM